jgi:hypothetical protein
MHPEDPRPKTDVGDLPKVSAATARELCAEAQLSADATALLDEAVTPRDFLSTLIKRELFTDGVKFLAHALPKKEAVFWACVCAREASEPGTAAMRALEAAERWVREPSEDHRRAAMAAVDAAGLDTPGACAAFGAFLSGGSLAPPNVPAVPPAEHLTGHAVGGSVMLAAVAREPEKAPEKYRRFLEAGIRVAQGTLSLSQRVEDA